MRDAYSQLRRSAYDMGTAATPVDDLGGVRIKPTGSHARSGSREVTLLENGMIVEHVDVIKEEREDRERKRKEERRERSRARKTSRSSAMDVTSIYSIQSVTPIPDSGGISPMPSSRYSQSLVLTNPPVDPPMLPLTNSPAFSDAQSLGHLSPRSKFFGFKNMSQSWRSQDSLAASGMSGSMINMQYVLLIVCVYFSLRCLIAWLLKHLREK